MAFGWLVRPRRLQPKIESAVTDAVDRYCASDAFLKIVENAISESPLIKFIEWMKFEMMRVDPSIPPKTAWNTACGVLRLYLADEKAKFGDARLDWSKDSAIDIIHSYEIEYWEGAPQ